MEMSFSDIQSIVADSVQLGYMYAIKSFEPVTDTIKECELNAWCLSVGIDKRIVVKLIKHGSLKKRRTGTARNSPFVYSKSDIKQAMLSLSLSNINKRGL